MMRVDSAAMVADLRRLAIAVPSIAHAALEKATGTAWADARATAAFKDGTTRGKKGLRASIRLGSSGSYRFYVIAGAPHALYVEEDTRAHKIAPKQGGLLRFQVGGRWVTARGVRHPGTTGVHFMRDARDRAEKILIGIIEERLGALLR